MGLQAVWMNHRASDIPDLLKVNVAP